MQILIVQLSDLHIRAKGNPLSSRVDQLSNAIGSILPRPATCIVLVTGDIAYEGSHEEYTEAKAIFSAIRSRLENLFGPRNVHFSFIPGNHDCVLPKEQIGVRASMVDGAAKTILQPTPDMAYVEALLQPQQPYYEFVKDLSGDEPSVKDRVCDYRNLLVSGKRIGLISINTALLSQRYEQAGTLSLPTVFLEHLSPESGDSDVVLCMYHHPSNWFEPNFRREFLLFVETSSHVVFTGHEHSQDAHWSEATSGLETAYIQADALQDRDYPKTSGFNCLLIDFDESTQRYYHFRWKRDSYSAIVDGKEHPIDLTARASNKRLHLSERFRLELMSDDFGFTNKNQTDLGLADFFVYPSLLITQAGNQRRRHIAGKDVFNEIAAQRSVFLQGEERIGKTALLKVLFNDFYKATYRVPVLLKGAEIPRKFADFYEKHLYPMVRYQYGDEAVETFRQLSPRQRILFIDDYEQIRMTEAEKKHLITSLSSAFGLLVFASNRLPDLSDYGAAADGQGETNDELFSAFYTIREMTPSGRAELVRRWLRLGREDIDEATLTREAENEQNLLSDLIRRKALPSLPYLIVGVLQTRQYSRDESTDPGSFGFLFQRLVLDALSVTTGTSPHIDRKDGILKRFAYRLFQSGTDVGSRDDFYQSADLYREEIGVKTDGEALFQDLLSARILKESDGVLSFRHPHFYHYFLAKQLMDRVDSDNPDQARQELEYMADHPLIRTNQLTLIFFLFFKSRDPIVDRLLKQADETFSTIPLSDLVTDVRFVDEGLHVLEKAHVDEVVSVEKERVHRLENEDQIEDESQNRPENALAVPYSDELPNMIKVGFAQARMELLGQIIRGFSGTLDRKKKVQILQSVFKLGLRTLHAALEELAAIAAFFDQASQEKGDKDEQRKAQVFIMDLIGLLTRFTCDGIFLTISRSVGISDIESTYEEAIASLAPTCATMLLELTVKLDHSDSFPMRLLQQTNRRVSKESQMASAVLSDLVVRHTQIFPLASETLRRIAGELRLDSVKLLEASGGVKTKSSQ